MRIPLEHKTPAEIYNVMRRSVMGQDEPLKAVATALSAHISRCIHNNQPWAEKPIQKDNLIILGPTGTGKTESVRTAIRELDLPFPMAIVATNALSNTGYKGKNIEDVLYDLAADAKRLMSENINRYIEPGDYELAEKEDGSKVKKLNNEKTSAVVKMLCEHGILILDEFDKLRFSAENQYEGIYKRNLQYELLKLVEGTKGIGENAFIQSIDTSNILIIGMGAFSDLLNPPPERAPVGFSGHTTEPVLRSNDSIPTTGEICDFGMVEELIGRFPLRCRYNALSAEDLYKILKVSDISPVKDFKNLFWETGNILRISNSALKAIARKAVEINIGARGLRTILGQVLYPILFNVDGTYKNHCITINRDTINTGKTPVIEPLPACDAPVKKRLKKRVF